MERRKLHNTYGGFATKHEKLVHPSPSQTTKKSVVPAFREGRGLGIVVPDAAQAAVVEDGDDDEHEHGEDEVVAGLSETLPDGTTHQSGSGVGGDWGLGLGTGSEVVGESFRNYGILVN